MFNQLEDNNSAKTSISSENTNTTQKSTLNEDKHISYKNVIIENILSVNQDPNLIESITLTNNGLSNIPESITAFPNLSRIGIYSNSILFIPNFIFHSFRQLKILSIVNCKIKKIPDEIINLQNLEVLNLPQNNITYVCPGVFCLPKLTLLHLESNKIKGLYIPFGFNSDRITILLNDNPLISKDRDDGLLGKSTLKTIFGSNIKFYEEQAPELETCCGIEVPKCCSDGVLCLTGTNIKDWKIVLSMSIVFSIITFIAVALATKYAKPKDQR
jgi:hypothetical protein